MAERYTNITNTTSIGVAKSTIRPHVVFCIGVDVSSFEKIEAAPSAVYDLTVTHNIRRIEDNLHHTLSPCCPLSARQLQGGIMTVSGR